MNLDVGRPKVEIQVVKNGTHLADFSKISWSRIFQKILGDFLLIKTAELTALNLVQNIYTLKILNLLNIRT